MSRCGLAGAVLFVALCCWILPYPGVQTDEVLFGAAIFHGGGTREWFRAFGHNVPTMLMPYVGALKTWLYWPIFAVWPPDAWSIRLPMVLLGAGTIYLFARFVQRAYGAAAAWTGVLLLATDTSLVLTTTFDWGPVALQHFLFMLATGAFWRFEREGRWWLLALGAFACGLALWNKALFAWTLMGCGTALCLVFPRRLWQLATWRNLAVAAVFFAGGASLLIRYNVRSHGGTFAMNEGMRLANISDKPIHVRAMLEGSGLMGYLVQEDNYTTTRWSLLVYVMLAAALLALASRRAALIFPLVAALLTWLAMSMTKDGGGTIHHAVLLYPLLHWMAAAAFTQWPVARPAVIALAALLAADNVRLVNVHRDNVIRLGSGPFWTDAIYPLARRVRERQPKAIRLYDWGMQDNLIVLTASRLPITAANPPFDEQAFTAVPDALWISAVQERIPGVNQGLAEAAARAGFEKIVRERIRDRHGREVFELAEYRRVAR